MPKADSTPLPATDVTTAKVTLLTLLVAWTVLLAWALANADTLARPVAFLLPGEEGGDAPPAPVVVADTSPYTDVPEGVRESASTDEAAPAEPSGARDRGDSAETAIGSPAPVVPPAEAVEVVEPSVSEALETAGPREPVEAVEAVEAVGAVESVEPAAEVDRERSVAADERVLESLFEARRLEELATLPEIASGLQFAAKSEVLSASLREPLERVFEILFLYPDTAVDIMVTGNEHGDTASDLLLSRARGQAIVDHLVSRGLERGRFELDIGVGDGLPPGEHRVRVLAEDDFR